MSMSHQPWVRGAGGCQTFNHSELDAHHVEPSHQVEFYLTTHWRGRGCPPSNVGAGGLNMEHSLENKKIKIQPEKDDSHEQIWQARGYD